MKKTMRQFRWFATLTAAVLLVCAVLAVPASAATLTASWTGAGGDISWANGDTPNNWSITPALPGSADDVGFSIAGAVPLADPPSPTNEVTASTTINTLWYNQEDPTQYVHTTVIDSGQTLKISGNWAGPDVPTGDNTGWQGNLSLLAGNFNASGTTTVSQTIIKGEGMLDVSAAGGGDTGGDIMVRQTAASQGRHNAILDMSGLATFNANVNQLLVGYTAASTGGTNSTQRAIGTLYLAQTNTIQCNYNTTTDPNKTDFIVGYATGNSAVPTSQSYGGSFVYLGQNNTFKVDGVMVGGRKGMGTLAYNPIFSNASLNMRGQDGSSPVKLITIGDNINNGTSSTSPRGTVDLTDVDTDILATSIILGRTPSGAGASTTTNADGTLTFNKGIIDVADLTLGLQSASSGCGATGTVNISGTGTLSFGASGLKLAQFAGGTGSSTGMLNISGGTVETLAGALGADITDAGGASTINMTGGMIDMQGHMIGSAGAPIDTVNLDNALLDNVAQLSGGAVTILNNVTFNVSLPGPFNLGDSFDVFNWSSLTGTFSTVNLPALSGGLEWDYNLDLSHVQFYSNGTIQVVPEPATLILLLMGAATLFVLRRR